MTTCCVFPVEALRFEQDRWERAVAGGKDERKKERRKEIKARKKEQTKSILSLARVFEAEDILGGLPPSEPIVRYPLWRWGVERQ